MSVTRSAGNFVASDNSGYGGTEDLGSRVVVAMYLGHFAETAFGSHCSSILPCFFQMGQFSPNTHFSAFGATVAQGVTCSWVCGSIFMGGFDVVIVESASPSST